MNDAAAAERYVAGRMNDSEIADFEAKMLESPQLAIEVRLRHRIKAGLELLEERRELEAIVTGHQPRREPLRYAMAATVTLALFTAGLFYWQRQPDMLLASDELSPGVSREYHLLTLTRGAPNEPLEVKSEAVVLELRALVDGDEGARYEVRLERIESGESRMVGTASAARDSEGQIAVFAPAGDLPSGRYRLWVAASGASGDARSTEFTVIRASK